MRMTRNLQAACGIVFMMVAVVLSAGMQQASAADLGGVTSGLALWVRADMGVTQNNGGVSGWADQSGNHRNAGAPAGKEPQLVSSVSGPLPGGLGGRPTLRFDGGQLLEIAANVLASDHAEFSVFGVAKSNQEDNAAIFGIRTDVDKVQLDQGGVAGSGKGQPRFIVGNQTVFAKSNPAVNVDVPTGYAISSGVVTADGTTRDVQMYYGGVKGVLGEVDLGEDLVIASGSTQIGGLECCGGYQLYFQGDIAEVIVYDRALSESEVNDVHSYLTTRYSVPEPGGLSLLGIATGWLLLKSRYSRKSRARTRS